MVSGKPGCGRHGHFILLNKESRLFVSRVYYLRFVLMKQFTIPSGYRSDLIRPIKEGRKKQDKLKKDFTPTVIDLGPVRFLLARHFGFCYGVENAIEIAFRTVEENPGKRIFLLSEMIHNPLVNQDLLNKGVRFLQDTSGQPLIPLDSLDANDIVIIPAFGTTLDMEKRLQSIGIQTESYDTTCPFVEKVWNRSEQIAKKQFTIIVHGKASHEETRATFSHAAAHAPTLVIENHEEAAILAAYINGQTDPDTFYTRFKHRYSAGFDVKKDLQRIGVVNQTTMLASETQGIADFLKGVVLASPTDHLTPDERFADTRDTLCYATNDNQTAVLGMLECPADLAIIIGGYNSSNTSHLVELCEDVLPSYHIDHPDRILDNQSIQHFFFRTKEETISTAYLPSKNPVTIALTAGASCPDALMEAVIRKIASFYGAANELDQWSAEWNLSANH